ncbi:Uncharacterised protein [Burkholderia cepacia]|uniref:Uncharacterized protein n=1 Tax=Burkholderia cepacia TaxID=292 RepID=A0AAE8T3E5_BURCE|nr:hypothetical protein CSX04_08349 [Burkholderia cepacia]SPV19717.1 Uncharacterised protein [Burkholderia cepacia]
MYVDDPLKRDFYIELCRLERWSSRQLQERMNSRYAAGLRTNRLVGTTVGGICRHGRELPRAGPFHTGFAAGSFLRIECAAVHAVRDPESRAQRRLQPARRHALQAILGRLTKAIPGQPTSAFEFVPNPSESSAYWP